jgi:hypothetical protein
MRRIFLLFFIVLTLGSKSQNYIITMLDTIKYGNCGDLLLPTVTFSNTITGTVFMHMERITKNIPSGWTSCFCAPECLPQTQSVYDFTIGSIGSKGNPDGTQDVSPNFGTDSIPGVGEVIVVFNEIGVNKFDTIHFRGITSKLSGINEIKSHNNEYKLYPNPACRSVNLSFKQDKQKPEKIELYSVVGKKVKDISCNDFVNESEIIISTEDLANGVYYMKISSGTSQKTLRLSVSN